MKKIIILAITAVMLAVMSPVCMAQSTVSGNVSTKERFGSLPIPGSTVRIENTNYQTTTDEIGAYRIDNVQLLNGTITASKLGFQEENKTLRLVVNFELDPARETGFWDIIDQYLNVLDLIRMIRIW